MTSSSIVTRLWAPAHAGKVVRTLQEQRPPLDLHGWTQHPALLPRWVRRSPLVQRYLELLGPLDWGRFPERDLTTTRGMPTVPFKPFVAACLVKLDQQLPYFSQLHQYLKEHPALAWLLGFPPVGGRWPFQRAERDVCLPTPRHFPRLLHKVPNASLQVLLDETVRLLRAELATVAPDFGQVIALDTKHILAWVRENNPRESLKDRYVKEQQPAGDPDCRLGCKRKRNQLTARERQTATTVAPPTPPDNPIPAATIAVAEYYWGYASGIVTTKVPGWGEFVLAELTLPFNQPDVAYFLALMEATEQRLGFRPRYGAFDAAFDCFYIYEYFHRPDLPIEAGFAAIPLSGRGGQPRRFDAQGAPLCVAEIAMPLKYTFTCKTTRVQHERGRYVCPLSYPHRQADCCPVQHKNWEKGGCVVTLPTSVGTRIRYQLDRHSERFQQVYAQRTATERLFSCAKALGIERPKLRNRHAIANQNTLIYILLNLRALQRIREQKRRES